MFLLYFNILFWSDNNIKGDASTKTDIYIKHNHGK
jgi:hypothetical protein